MAEATPDGLPPLRQVIEALTLTARRSLGQNFLTDLNLTRRIARAAGDLGATTVLEVGPGPGGLTRALLMEGAARVVAIEKDTRFLPALREIAAAYPARLEVVEGDALELDHARLLGAGAAAGGRFAVVANLPYNVGTPLLTGWLSAPDWPPWWSSLTLMFQREVAERIVAQPGTGAYGRLAVLAGLRTRAEIAFDVNPRAFVPPPKVVSSVVHIVPCEPVAPVRADTLSRVTAAAFGQRRKMLRQSLKSLGRPVEPLLEAAAIAPTARAETVDVAGFCRLAAALDGN